MKALRFCFTLFGLFFLLNGTLKAQIGIELLEISVDNISPALIQVAPELQVFNVTVKSNGSCNLAIGLHSFIAHQQVIGASATPYYVDSFGSVTTMHTFIVLLPVGDIAYLTCGNIDNSGTYRASDGGCIIGTDLEP